MGLRTGVEDTSRSQERATINRIQEGQDCSLTRQYSAALLGNRKRGGPDKFVERGCITISSSTDARLIEILKIYRGKPVPNKPETTIPRRKQLPVVGTLIEKVKQLDVENAT